MDECKTLINGDDLRGAADSLYGGPRISLPVARLPVVGYGNGGNLANGIYGGNAAAAAAAAATAATGNKRPGSNANAAPLLPCLEAGAYTRPL